MLNEKDGNCHWRRGLTAFDIGDQLDFSNWYCQEPLSTTTIVAPTATASTLPQLSIPTGLKCTSTPAGNRIVGGIEANRNSWPWIVRLNVQIDNSFYLCGGTIIDDQTILTAAHCCENQPKITAYSGDHSFSEYDLGERSHLAKRIIIHPNYNKSTLQNDICILKMKNSMNLTKDKYADFACLPESES